MHIEFSLYRYSIVTQLILNYLGDVIVVFDNVSILALSLPKLLTQHTLKGDAYGVCGILRPSFIRLYGDESVCRTKEKALKTMIEDAFATCLHVYPPPLPISSSSRYVVIVRIVNSTRAMCASRDLLYSKLKKSGIILLDDEGAITFYNRNFPTKEIDLNHIRDLGRGKNETTVDELDSAVFWSWFFFHFSRDNLSSLR